MSESKIVGRSVEASGSIPGNRERSRWPKELYLVVGGIALAGIVVCISWITVLSSFASYEVWYVSSQGTDFVLLGVSFIAAAAAFALAPVSGGRRMLAIVITATAYGAGLLVGGFAGAGGGEWMLSIGLLASWLLIRKRNGISYLTIIFFGGTGFAAAGILLMDSPGFWSTPRALSISLVFTVLAVASAWAAWWISENLSRNVREARRNLREESKLEALTQQILDDEDAAAEEPRYDQPTTVAGTQPRGLVQVGTSPDGRPLYIESDLPIPRRLEGPAKSNVFAILTLIFGLLGGLVAIPFGHIALVQIKRTGESGRGMALAGLILGYVWLAALVAYFIFIAVLVAQYS